MDKKTIMITEHNGTYQVQNNGISEFALIGILECILFDLKSIGRQDSNTGHQESTAKQNEVENRQSEKPSDLPAPLEEAKEANKTEEAKITEDLKSAAPEPKRGAAQSAVTPNLHTRISNAIKAIRGLGAQIDDTDLSNLTEEELQSELEELTSQYKRLKNSKGTGK